MKKTVLRKVVSIFLALLMICSTVPMLFTANAASADVSTSVETDANGATVTTEKGKNYTKMTYSMTMGTAGTAGNYVVYKVGQAENYYSGHNTGYSASSVQVGVVIKVPVVFASNVSNVDVAVTRVKDGRIAYFVATEQPATIADRDLGLVSSSTWEPNGVLPTKDLSAKAAEVLAADTDASSLYITLGCYGLSEGAAEWNSPRISAVEISVTYNTTWKTESTTDSKGASITTTTKGNDYTAINYSMKAGTSGTSDNFYVSSNSSAEGSYGAGWTSDQSGSVVYRFPVSFATNLTKFVLAMHIDYSKYHVSVGVDNTDEAYGDVVASCTTGVQDGTQTYDLSSAVIAKLAAANYDASYVYVKLTQNGDANQPKIEALSVDVAYNTVWSTETTTDENGAVISTLTKGTDYTKIDYSFTCGSSGTGANYRVAGGQGVQSNTSEEFDGGWKSFTTYAFPVQYAENVTGFAGTVKSISAQPCNFKVYVGVIDATTFGDPVATVGPGSNGDSYNFNFSSEVVTLLASNPNASYIYIKFAVNTNDNAPRLASVAAQVTYNTTWETLTETDANGAVINTAYKGANFTSKTYSFTGGTNGTSGNFKVTGGSGDGFDGGWENKVTYRFPLLDAANFAGLKTTITPISNQPSNFLVYVGVTDKDTFSDPVYTVNQSGNGIAYSCDLTEAVAALLQTNPDAEYVYVRFAYNNNGNATKFAANSTTISYNSFIVDSDIKAVDVSLDGTIGLKLGLVMPSSILNSANTVKVLDSESNTVAEFAADEYEEIGGYKFFAVDVAAAYMTEAYTLQVVTADATYTASAAYSVRDYAVGMMETADDATYALLEAMLNYGAFAQTYFGINTDDLANDDGQDGAIVWAYTSDDLDSMVTLPESNASSKEFGDTFYHIYAGVGLESEIAINVQFVNGDDKTLYTKEIVAKELLDTHTFEHDGATFTISFNDYAYKVLNDTATADNTALTDLVKATLLYGTAASEYFAAQAN